MTAPDLLQALLGATEQARRMLRELEAALQAAGQAAQAAVVPAGLQCRYCPEVFTGPRASQARGGHEYHRHPAQLRDAMPPMGGPAPERLRHAVANRQSLPVGQPAKPAGRDTGQPADPAVRRQPEDPAGRPIVVPTCRCGHPPRLHEQIPGHGRGGCEVGADGLEPCPCLQYRETS